MQIPQLPTLPRLAPPPLPILTPLAANLQDDGADFATKYDLPPAQDEQPHKYSTVDPIVEIRKLERADRVPMNKPPLRGPGVYEVCFGRTDQWFATYFDGKGWPYISVGFALAWRGLAQEFQG